MCAAFILPARTELEEASVHLHVLRNISGMEVHVTNYGATVVAVHVRDRDGRYDDVVLGFDSLDDYRAHSWHCGATVGRFAGRIAGAHFSLDGSSHALPANDGPNHLHGGLEGFDKVVWEAQSLGDESALQLRYVSADGEEGYPGTLDAQVMYTITDENELIVDYLATADQPTPVNLTHHSYFNLAGNGDILDHELVIDADSFLPVDAVLIPIGELRSVAGTPFDFRRPVRIGARIGTADPQLEMGGGYDHDFAVREAATTRVGARLAAHVLEPVSGRVLEVFTTQPALHFYSGNFLPAQPPGKKGVTYGPRAGFALEAQHFTDSPNQRQFPSTILRPGAQYRARTIYRFSVSM